MRAMAGDSWLRPGYAPPGGNPAKVAGAKSGCGEVVAPLAAPARRRRFVQFIGVYRMHMVMHMVLHMVYE